MSALVRDAVIRLTRLVQRAAIYPPGHPTVRLLLAPFLDAVAPFTDGTTPLRMAVLRDRLIAAAGDSPPQEHESKWLAGQLHGRGVSTINIEGPVDAEELLAFARWLSGPAQPVNGRTRRAAWPSRSSTTPARPSTRRPERWSPATAASAHGIASPPR